MVKPVSGSAPTTKQRPISGRIPYKRPLPLSFVRSFFHPSHTHSPSKFIDHLRLQDTLGILGMLFCHLCSLLPNPTNQYTKGRCRYRFLSPPTRHKLIPKSIEVRTGGWRCRICRTRDPGQRLCSRIIRGEGREDRGGGVSRHNLDAAQARFFARAVADPTAIGDLWLASMNPAKNGWRKRVGTGGTTERTRSKTMRQMGTSG